MMSYKENIRAILECHFAGFKDELIDSAVDSIMDLTENKKKCVSEFNFHKEGIINIINRMDDAETYSGVDFYASEAMNILLKMRDCKYADLGGNKNP